MTGHASMGTAIAAACGVRLAKPNRTVTAICGDGGFLMSLADVNTAVQERLPLLIAVLNDFRYAMVELGHQKVYGRDLKYPVTDIDITNLAHGCGASAAIVRTPQDFASLDIEQRTKHGPLVLDIRIDPRVAIARLDRFEKRQN
jgi:acetolactate synthase-1/2/3 large subunit